MRLPRVLHTLAMTKTGNLLSTALHPLDVTSLYVLRLLINEKISSQSGGPEGIRRAADEEAAISNLAIL